MANEPRVRVTAYDPVTGDTDTSELDPNSYVLICGQNMQVTSLAAYANGTVSLTIKRVPDGE